MTTILSRMRLQALARSATRTRLWADESGTAAIETSISYMLMINCVLGIIGVTLMVYTYCVYVEAVRVGVRYAVVHGVDSSNCSGPSTGCGDPSGNKVVDAVNNYARTFAALVSGASVQVSYPDTGGCTPPSRVIITATYTYNPFVKILPGGLTFHFSSQGRIVY
jgi:Flp pilus assembly protein TadG